MGRKMKTVFLMTALAAVLLCQTVFAEQSQLELGLDNSGRIFATNVADDDGSIESLDIFVLDEGTEYRFHYDNVLEGQVLDVSIKTEGGNLGFGGKENNSNQLTAVFAEEIKEGSTGQTEFSDPKAVYYNFLDADGAVTNSKFFVYLKENTGKPEVKNVNRTRFFHPLTSKTMTARKDGQTNNYFLDVKITGNRIDKADLEYYFSNPEELQRVELAQVEEGVFGATLGPFNGNMSIDSKAIVTSGRFAHEYLFGKREFGAVGAANQFGECSGFSSTLTKDNVFQKANTALLQIAGENFRFSTIRIIEDEPGNLPAGERLFRVTRVFDDDDQKIDLVEFIAETAGGGTQHYSFQKVGVGDEIRIRTPGDSKVYYNYMDFTDKYSGINYFLPVKKQDVLEMPFFTATDRSDMINQAQVEVVPSEDCSSFSLKAKVLANGMESKVYLKYGFSENDQPFFAELPRKGGELKGQETQKALLQGENEYEQEIPLESEIPENGLEFFAEVYAENDEGRFDKLGGLNQWTGFFEGQKQPPAEEICGNGTDDDLDGNIDEDCLFFPDLLFSETNIRDLFVSGETNLVSATVKNAGLSGSESFEVGFYLNNSLIGPKEIGSLSEGGEDTIEIEFVPPEGITGPAEARLVIDPSNSITELDEQNNEETKQVAVGKNSFRVVPNFNDSDFLGDTRKIRVFDAMGNPVEEAQIEISSPSGKTKKYQTNSQGIASFLLEESGAHTIKVTKNGFEDFEGAFSIPGIILGWLKTQYALGEPLEVSISTEEGQKIQDFTAKITTPLNETRTFSSGDYFQLSAPGSYRMEITRNNVKIAQATFVVSGLVESVVFEGIISSLTGGSLIKDTPLFVFILLLSAIAAYLVSSRQELLFGAPRYDTTSQKRLRLVAKLFSTLAAFFLPFVVARFFGFNPAAIAAIAMILAMLFLEFRAKKARQRKPFGF